MKKSGITRSGARRLGDDYQDVVALKVLVDWLEHTNRYAWVRVEADDAGYLDDVVALTSDERLIAKQVKYSTDPDSASDPLRWDTLLAKSGKSGRSGGSLLQKWAGSLTSLRSEHKVVDASLVSNRRPSSEIEDCLSLEGFIDYSKIANGRTRRRILTQLGGKENTLEFFRSFRFALNEPSLRELQGGVRKRFLRLGGTDHGWLNLASELGFWVARKGEPPPDGRIRLSDIRRAAIWNELKELPQAFQIPSDYVLPDKAFHKWLVRTILFDSIPCLVLAAGPGVGKSTYASFLFRRLRRMGVPAVRHHYYLSVSDSTSNFRVEHRRAAESLMHDLQKDFTEAVGDLASENPRTDMLRNWLDACGRYYSNLGKTLVLIIDGLDHVWRSRGSIKELEKLVGLLLPAPTGVTILFVSQPVDDSLLPRSLLRVAPRDTWLSLPTLNERAVQRWLTHHRHVLGTRYEQNHDGYGFRRLAKAFHHRSSGHPLHLRYSLKAIEEQGLPVTEQTLARLPGCGHEDIRNYYADLWHVLEEGPRMVLHLMAACKFPWPRQGIFDCLDPVGHDPVGVRTWLKQVIHLLRWDELGLAIFHPSLIVFVEGLEEHADYSGQMKSLALEWLNGGRAPEYWKWAHAWILEADLGNDTAVREGPSRDWLIDSIAKGYSYREIDAILSKAAHSWLEHGDLPGAARLGILREYCQLPFETNYPVLDELLFAQLALSDDPHIRARMISTLRQRRNSEIVLLAENEIMNGQPTRASDCLRELQARDNLSGPRDNQTVLERTSLLASWANTAAMLPDVEATLVLGAAATNRWLGRGLIMVSSFARELRVQKDAGRLRETIRASRELKNEERSAAFEQAVLLALEESLDFDSEVRGNAHDDEPFGGIYAFVRKLEGYKPGIIRLPNVDPTSFRRFELDDRTAVTEEVLHSLFFGFLANHLWNRGNDNKRLIETVNDTGWLIRFIEKLDGIAAGIALTIAGGRAPTISDLYSPLTGFHRIEWPEARDRYFLDFENSIDRAINRIGLDLIPVARALDPYVDISQADLEVASLSGYWRGPMWVPDYVGLRRRWLSQAALLWLLSNETGRLGRSVDEFPDRAMQYALLANLAALHDLENRSRELIRDAIGNLIAHGDHKDMLFFGVIGAITACHDAGVREVRDWAVRLAPAIAHINRYTDGDHTGDLPQQLGELLARIAPDLFSVYHNWLAETGEYYYALESFRAFIRVADLSSPTNQAIARTAVDQTSLAALSNREQRGDRRARDALSSLSTLVRPEPFIEASLRQESLFQNPTVEASPEDYPPDNLMGFLIASASSGWPYSNPRIGQWIRSWVGAGRGEEALAALEKAYELSAVDSDTIFDTILSLYGRQRAYPWLVRAQVEGHGWDQSYGPRESAVRRWGIMKTTYPELWFEFLRHSVRLKYADPWDSFYFYPLMFSRIVEYCFYMDKPEVGKEVAEQILDSSLELVSAQNLTAPQWVEGTGD